MPDLYVVVLAAGKGTRMKSAVPKVLHPLAGVPLIEHVLRTVDQLKAAGTVLVIGHGADAVRTALADRPTLQFVLQTPQLGTGHALLQTESALTGRSGNVLLVSGDVPLLRTETLVRLAGAHAEARAAATVLTAELPDPYGYGRIVRDKNGHITRIVEERDASGDERDLREINTGIYAFALEPLFAALHDLAADNAQSEYYLTDLVAAYHRRGLRVETLRVGSADELRGVNSRVDLADLNALVRARKNRALMLSGVTLEDPASTYVDEDTTVGPDTVVGPGVRLQGSTVVGARCRLHAGSRLTDATVGDDVTILDYSVITASTVAAGASVGPFAHIRPDSIVGEQARIGNFVELKKTRVGRGSKASHLSYLGDTTVGEDVNIGAGTITCNYDGEQKHQTVIEDGAFIGSDSQLVAPVTGGKGAYGAAGSSVVSDVPAGALASGRVTQQNKPDWAARRRARTKKDEA